MASSLRQLALVLQVAEELHEEGKLKKSDYLRLISNVEADYNNSANYVKELKSWLLELLRRDSATGHVKNLDHLLMSFLSSADANDQDSRVEILEMIQHFKKLLILTEGYNEKLLLKQLNKIQN